MDRPSSDLIVAAVNGDEEALEKIIRHYQPMIEEESKGNPMVRMHVTRALREAILHFDLENPEANERYLQSKGY